MSDKGQEARLRHYAQGSMPTAVRVQALAALYIGDGLRKVADAIDGCTTPTMKELRTELEKVKTLHEANEAYIKELES